MESEQQKKEFVKTLMEKNILVSPDLLLEIMGANGAEDLSKIAENLEKANGLVLSKELASTPITKETDFDFVTFDKTKALFEKDKNKTAYQNAVERLKESLSVEEAKNDTKDLEVTFSYAGETGSWSIQDFVSMFNKRYKYLEGLLAGRRDLSSTTSISRLLSKRDRGNVSVIGIVKDKSVTKNGNMMVTIEDPTGEINVVIPKSKKDLYAEAQNIVLDEVIGIVGASGEKILFANSILWPEIPNNPELRTAPNEDNAVFIGDIHIGSKHFLKESFEHFIQWLAGTFGNDIQKQLARKVKYVFIVGDLVEGVGIYPDQEKDLLIPDIYEQYKALAEYLKQIPERIKIIMCPGNHDATRMSEPQPRMEADFAKPICDLPNAVHVSNPSYVTIGITNEFSGLKILLYHGGSFPYYADAVEEIRQKGGLERVDLIMKSLLRRRHLAPTQTSSLYVPEPKFDPLLITTIPDFFVTGHIHRASASNYNNITLLNCSCWIGQTDYQEKMGLKPQPTRATVVNLKTRGVKVLRF
jgi:DNA polymerase II small subunit